MREVAPPEPAPGADRVERTSPPAVREVLEHEAEAATTIVARASDDLHGLFSRMADAVPPGHVPLAGFVFGRLGALRGFAEMLHPATGPMNWPILAVEGAPCHDGALAGAQVYSAPAAAVRRVVSGGEVVGSVFDDDEATHCLLAGVGPERVELPAEAQAHETFQRLESALHAGGFELADVVRTWFYNRRILDWYREFNRARSAIYARVSFRGGAVPASTGIEGYHPTGAALAMAAWATRRRSPAACIASVPSPLQCPASQYGSAFSRAMEVTSGGRRRVLVSGTAAIDGAGRTVWPGEVHRQVDHTMHVVEAILAERGLTLAQVRRAIAYFKRGVETSVFDDWLREHGLEEMPHLRIRSDVCRDDLLFEIEVDAAAALSV